MISEEHLTVVEDDVIADKFKTRYNMELPLPFIRQILGLVFRMEVLLKTMENTA